MKEQKQNKMRIALLGSTGSIGVQTLDVVEAWKEEMEVIALTAHRNWELLAEQARHFEPDCVVIADENYYKELSEALADLPIKVYAGAEAVAQVAAASNVDVVVNALVGYAGMLPSLAAVEAGKKLALANKESLVVAGDIIIERALQNRAPIVPIDSEHSAIYQCLVGEVSAPRRLILTASGGPFRRTPAEELYKVSAAEALKHPNWSMGAKITIDSATLVNKGFEVIEAHWLFGMPAERIDVVVHPQSVIHSMVEFEDGAIKAQLGTPDMHLPIQYALRAPLREHSEEERFDFLKNPTLTFEQVDNERFPMLSVAYDCLRRGGNAACVMNGANEVAVAAFLRGEIGFMDIPRVICGSLERVDFIGRPTLDDYIATDAEARSVARELLHK
ncbi:MAG: 1-deoxy-D-xylulose-5-phosphate reductoisomerase [Tidjanibacter sp.]|nr:1-deoxy-D-xylulose-5-phosphate reductoisomerase [Tidjanibacter sp.]